MIKKRSRKDREMTNRRREPEREVEGWGRTL